MMRSVVRGTDAYLAGCVMATAVAALAGIVTITGRAEGLVGPSMLAALCCVAPAVMAVGGAAVMVIRMRSSSEARLWSIAAVVVIAESIVVAGHSTMPVLAFAGNPAVSTIASVVALTCLAFLVLEITSFADLAWHDRGRVAADMVGASLVVAPVVYLVWTGPAFNVESGGDYAAAFVASFYPVVAVFPALALGIMSVGVGSRAWKTWERTLAAYLVFEAMSSVLFPVHLLDSTSGHAVFLAFHALKGVTWGTLAITIALRARAPRSDRVYHWPLPELLPETSPVLFPVVLAMALPVLAYVGLSSHDPSRSAPVFVSMVALSVVLALRSVLSSVGYVDYASTAAIDPRTGALTGIELIGALDDVFTRARHGTGSCVVVAVGFSDLRYAIGMPDRSHDAFIARSAELLAQMAGTRSVYAESVDRLYVLLSQMSVEDAAVFGRRLWLALTAQAEESRLLFDIAVALVAVPSHATTHEQVRDAVEVTLAAARAGESEPVLVYGAMAARPKGGGEDAGVRLRAIRATARYLAEVVDARDPRTQEHSASVAELATALAQVLGLSEDEVQTLGVAALMHDVGKVGVPVELLAKEGPLTSEERALIEGHAELSARILAATGVQGLVSIVRHHHERWDGAGYPDGLAGPQIPVGARILCVCDGFVMMTTRGSMSTALALTEIADNAGAQYDPEVAAAFVRMVERLEPAPVQYPH